MKKIFSFLLSMTLVVSLGTTTQIQATAAPQARLINTNGGWEYVGDYATVDEALMNAENGYIVELNDYNYSELLLGETTSDIYLVAEELTIEFATGLDGQGTLVLADDVTIHGAPTTIRLDGSITPKINGNFFGAKHSLTFSNVTIQTCGTITFDAVDVYGGTFTTEDWNTGAFYPPYDSGYEANAMIATKSGVRFFNTNFDVNNAAGPVVYCLGNPFNYPNSTAWASAFTSCYFTLGENANTAVVLSTGGKGSSVILFEDDANGPKESYIDIGNGYEPLSVALALNLNLSTLTTGESAQENISVKLGDTAEMVTLAAYADLLDDPVEPVDPIDPQPPVPVNTSSSSSSPSLPRWRDVDKNAPFYANVTAMVERGYIRCDQYRTFDVTGSITSDDVAYALAKIRGVSTGRATAWATEMGLISDNESAMTRTELAEALYAYASRCWIPMATDESALACSRDVIESPALAWAISNGIIKPLWLNRGGFAPLANAQVYRYEFANALVQFLTLIRA